MQWAVTITICISLSTDQMFTFTFNCSKVLGFKFPNFAESVITVHNGDESQIHLRQ